MIQNYLNKGYTVTSEGETTITLTKKKTVSIFEALLIIVGLFTLPFFGLGLLLWILALLNYIFRTDEVKTLTKVDKVEGE